MITWSTDKLKKEIVKGVQRKWLHLPLLQAELVKREAANLPNEKVLTPKLA